jgi:hypothetical protein
MFISKNHIPRRTMLRGMGVAMALPFLESMVPAQTPLRKSAAASRTRLCAIEQVHGASGSTRLGQKMHYWSPEKEGANFQMTPTLISLEPYQDYLTIITNTDLENARSHSPKEFGADHTRASAVYLTAAKPKMTEGADIHCGPSIDQIYAQKFGQDTPLPSIQLCIENVGSLSAACGYGYSCVYCDTISWASPTDPLPMERDPRVVFERLFGVGGTTEERDMRRREERSVLDRLSHAVAVMMKDLGPSDRNRLSAYLDDVREIERRIQKIEQYNTAHAAERQLPDAPIGVPDSWAEHVGLMVDLQTLAFMTETTRVSTLKLARDVSSAVYPTSGVSTPFHSCSHHGENAQKVAEFAKLNQYHVSTVVAPFVEKLKNTPDGDGNLLDHTLLLYGSPMGDSDVHEHKRLPLILVGHAGGPIKGNFHLKCQEGTPMANLLLTVLHRLGVEDFQYPSFPGPPPMASKTRVDQIGDSTEELAI